MKSIRNQLRNNRIVVLVYRFMYRVIATLFWNIVFIIDKLFHSKVVYGNCFVFTTPFGKLKKNNWGDDLNYYLFNSIITDKIRFVPFDKLFFAPKVEKYSLIGSIIGDFNLDSTIVYGSGAITSYPVIKGVPKKVNSVRGPLTREVLLRNGIECPEVYGDPALLVTKVYKPTIQKQDRIGIIPHYRTLETNWEENAWFTELSKRHEILVIDMSEYVNWTDIIDSICSCKYVFSESLHGLIIAEAYSVPSIWVEIQKHDMPWQWDFKFNDFYASINKPYTGSLKLYEADNVESMMNMVKDWKPGSIDYDAIIKAIPFELKRGIFDE